MASKEKFKGAIIREADVVPFETAEEAWFWFIAAWQAKIDGVRLVSGAGAIPRPCEPVDIMNILNRFYKSRLLLWDHFVVLRHYGVRFVAPDAGRAKEARASRLWDEAIAKLEPVLIEKGIVRQKTIFEEALAIKKHKKIQTNIFEERMAAE